MGMSLKCMRGKHDREKEPDNAGPKNILKAMLAQSSSCRTSMQTYPSGSVSTQFSEDCLVCYIFPFQSQISWVAQIVFICFLFPSIHSISGDSNRKKHNITAAILFVWQMVQSYGSSRKVELQFQWWNEHSRPLRAAVSKYWQLWALAIVALGVGWPQ